MNARQRRKSMRVYFQHLKHLPLIFDHIADQIMMGGDLRKLELECREVAENIRAEKWDVIK